MSSVYVQQSRQCLIWRIYAINGSNNVNWKLQTAVK